jgi:hypothetical protein
MLDENGIVVLESAALEEKLIKIFVEGIKDKCYSFSFHSPTLQYMLSGKSACMVKF